MRKEYIKIILGEVIIFVLFVIHNVSIPCLFKSLIHIPCPGCGMTRAFIDILHLNFLDAFHHNILSIPLFFFLIVINICMIYDFIKNDIFTKKVIYFVTNHYIWIIILLVFSEIHNIYYHI